MRIAPDAAPLRDAQPPPAITVLLADKDERFREFVKRLLGQTVKVVGETASGEGAVSLARELLPQVALIDIDIPGLDGISATRQMKAGDPNLKVILLTAHEEAYLSSTGKTGADSLLRKRDARAEILTQIRGVLSGFASWDGRERRDREGAEGVRQDGRERRPRGSRGPRPPGPRGAPHRGGA